jgi:hypothetical protein
MLPSSPYAGTTQNANLLAIVFALNSTGATTVLPTDYTLLIVGLIVVVAVVAIAAVVCMRKPGK